MVSIYPMPVTIWLLPRTPSYPPGHYPHPPSCSLSCSTVSTTRATTRICPFTMYSPDSRPWPRPTQPPSPVALQYPRPFKRRRMLERRQVIADQEGVIAAQRQCQVFSGNEVISCFPTTSTVVAQGEWASFVCALSSMFYFHLGCTEL